MNNLKRRLVCSILVCCTIFSILMPRFDACHAEPEAPPPDYAPASPSEYGELRTLIETALVTETENIQTLTERLNRLQTLGQTMETELNAYDIQQSAYANMMLLPQTPVETLESAWAAYGDILKRLSDRIREMQEGLNEITQRKNQTEEQLALTRKQLETISGEMTENLLKETLLEKIDTLIQRISEKLALLTRLEERYLSHLTRLTESRQKLADFADTLESFIRERKKAALFHRENIPDLSRMNQELARLQVQFRNLLSADVAFVHRRMAETGYYLVIAFFLLFGGIEYLLIRARRRLDRIDRKYRLAERYPWRHFTLQLFRRTLLLSGTTLFLLVYATVRNLYGNLSLFRVIIQILCVWLFARWGSVFLRLWNKRDRHHLDGTLRFRLQLLIFLGRAYLIGVILLIWLLGRASVILLSLRLLFELLLLIWCIYFWRAQPAHPPEEPLSRRYICLKAGGWLSYLIAVGGLILELFGYGFLALYWLTSWGLTAVILMWGLLFFCILREWRNDTTSLTEFAPQEMTPRVSANWLALQICWMIWAALLVLALISAWHVDRTVFIANYFHFLSRPLPLEGLELSFLSIFYAILAILLTHVLTSLWRKFFFEKFLAHSGLDRGLRNSITLISVYLIWLVGILLALNVIGFDVKSLTVLFGALGIGLGFGLQNIFNNFVSGLILLFERPIQVGDAVEINGIWGEVKKINVRATHVQTYDNASLIIPNSEFISSHVTNWSFKDVRIRRHIIVGVAYGSDTERVRETLLEVAATNRYVFKFPVPSVLFTDFGDSALTFNLRVWTDVDNCLTAETEIRFAIDRLFRERGIEIAFPQRDIHLRSVDGDIQDLLASGKLSRASGEDRS